MEQLYPLAGTSSCANQDSDCPNDWVQKSVEKEILHGKKLRELKARPIARREKYDVITISNSKLYCKKKRLGHRNKSPKTSRRKGGRKSTHHISPIRKKVPKTRKLSNKNSNFSQKRCPLRIEELAVPSKRQCIDTWRNKYHILPSIMLHRLQQQLFDLTPVVKIPEAIECFKRHKRLRRKKIKQEKIKAMKKDAKRMFYASNCDRQIQKKPIKLQECQNLCAIFGHKIARELNRPVEVTLNSELKKIFNVVSIEIENVIKQDKECRADRNKKTKAEVAGKISIWIANILEETAYKILEDQLQDLEEEVGPVLDLIDNLIDDVVCACEPEPSAIESSSSETIIVESSTDGKHEEDDSQIGENESHSSVEIDFPEENEMNVDEYIKKELDKIINSFDKDDQQDTEIENQTQQDKQDVADGGQEQNEFSDAYDNFDIIESSQDQVTNQDKFIETESQQKVDTDLENQQQRPGGNIDQDNVQQGIETNLNQNNSQQSTHRNIDQDGQQRSIDRNVDQYNLQQSTDISQDQGSLQQSTDRSEDQDNIEQSTDRNVDQDNLQQSTDRNDDQDNLQQSTDRNVSQDLQQIINKNIDQYDVQQSTDRNIYQQDIFEDDSIKKVTFSNIDIVTHDGKTEPAEVNFQNIQEIDPNLVLSEPNDNLLSDADELWPADMTFPILRPSESVSKSITSLGKIMEADERTSATLDEYGNAKVPFTTDTDAQLPDADKINTDTDAKLPEADVIIADSDAKLPKADINIIDTVSKSITSLGKIMEADERTSATLDEYGNAKVPLTTDTDAQLPDADKINTDTDAKLPEADVIIADSDAKLPKADINIIDTVNDEFGRPRDGKINETDSSETTMSMDEQYIKDDQLTQYDRRSSTDSTFDHHLSTGTVLYEVTSDKILEEQATQVAGKLDKLLENAAIQAEGDTTWEDKGTQVSKVEEEKKGISVDAKEEGTQVSPKEEGKKRKTADKEINTSFSLVPREDKCTSVISKSLEDITKRIQSVKPDDMFSSLRIKQKVDYKVHKQSAPFWVTRHYEEPSVSVTAPQQKTGDKHIRLWCRDLENGFDNLELWNGWIEKSLDSLSTLERKKAKICIDKSREEFVRDWYQLKKNVDADVLTWSKLSKSTHEKLKAFRKVYQSFKTLSSAPKKLCHCHP